MRIWIAAAVSTGIAFAADAPVTFHKDVLPILGTKVIRVVQGAQSRGD